MAHTPGPWRVEQDTTLVWGACVPDDGTSFGMGYPIAFAHVIPTAQWAKGPCYHEGEANARLIAAAPALLEALKEARRQLEAYEEAATGEGYNSLQINAAIAKAEGR